MVLGIVEDFSSNIALDSQLTALPSSGLYLNSGVHPSITVENLLSFLPIIDIAYEEWDGFVNYGVYDLSRKKKDIVLSSGNIYQSIRDNINIEPTASSLDWLETNSESLRLKSFIKKVEDRIYADLNLTKRLVNNQYLYEVGKQERQLPNDYCAWIFEPKGSDYITLRINEMCIQKSGTTPVDVYIINQGVLLDTISVTPKNGVIAFDKHPLAFSGKGKWIIAIDSTTVFSNNGYIDPLKFDGFVAYTGVGIGSSPETATYSYNSTGNGLGFNISAFLDATVYIENNLNEFSNYIRATFEYMSFLQFLHNSNNRKNMAERVQLDRDMLMLETKNLEHDTSVRRYYNEKKKAIKVLERTFDTQLANNNDELEVTISSI